MSITINEVRYLNPDTEEKEIATFTAFHNGVNVRGTDAMMPTVDIDVTSGMGSLPSDVAWRLANLFAYALGDNVTGRDVHTL